MRSLFDRSLELESVGVGPVDLDITTARKLGLTDSQIDDLWAAIVQVWRGAHVTSRYASGKACEYCLAAEPCVSRCSVCHARATGEEA